MSDRLQELYVTVRLSESDVVDLLRDAVDQAGSVAAWARTAGVSITYVHDVIAGRRPPGGAILEALSLSKVVTFIPRKDS